MIERNKQKIWELIPFLLFVTIFIRLLFIRVLGTGSTLAGGDFVNYFFPLKAFIRNHLLTSGSIPQWNPFQFSGTPLIANLQSSMFYPPGFLYYVLPSDSAYVYSTILHFILGSCFMYIFMRRLSVSHSGSFTSAMIFILNGYFMGHVYAGHLTFVQTYVWIPIIFLFLHKFIETRDAKHAVRAGLLLGIQILGGFPQITFYTILGLLLYGVFRGIILLNERHFRESRRLGTGLFLILFIGFAFSAIQVFPAMEFATISIRGDGVSYDFATSDSLNPKELLSFLIPDIFGSAVDKTYWPSLQNWHFWETCGYVGILPLMLLFVRVEKQYIRRFRLFFLILIAIAIFLATGKHNPLYPIIYKLPGFNIFRIPAQILFLYVFGMAVVSGIGVDRICNETWQTNKGFTPFFTLVGILFLFLVGCLTFFPFQLFSHLFRYFSDAPVIQVDMAVIHGKISFSIYKGALLFSCASLLLFVFKRKRIDSRILTILLPSIVLADLLLFVSGFIQPYQFHTSYSKKRVVTELKGGPPNGRVLTLNTAFKSNDGLKYGFPSILGYDPLILRRYVHYVQASQNQPPSDWVVNLSKIQDPEAKLLKLLHVKKVVRSEGILDVENEIPYVHIVNQAVIKPFGQVLSFMKSDQFDPHRMVVFEPGQLVEVSTRMEKEVSKTSCSIVEYQNESIRLKTSTDEPGYLVLSEIFYPGWQATVDGETAAVIPGNYLFRVIPLKEGDHEVHLFFVSWPFRTGIVVSLLTLVLSIGFILWNGKRSIPKKDEKGHITA